MKKTNLVVNIKRAIKEFKYRYAHFFCHRIKKYIVDYYIDGEYLIVESNLGAPRKVKNTHSNMIKLNKTIVKNKIAIANKIDEYERDRGDRWMLILTNIFILCGCGGIVPVTLFMGSYVLFLLSILLFFISVIVTFLIGLDYYIQIIEIQNLKRITGYKLDREFYSPRINLPVIKHKKVKDAN